MDGIRIVDNYYMFKSSLICNSISTDDSIVQHYKLGHLKYHDMKKLLKAEVVRGLPNLEIKTSNQVCGPCQHGKETRVYHKKLVYIFLLLELLNCCTWMQLDLLKLKSLEVRSMCFFMLMITLDLPRQNLEKCSNQPLNRTRKI